MDGALIRNTITTAPNWFAAVPSLHGAYPVLLFLLAWRERARMRWLVAIGAWGAAMWYATVALNQHYVVDLLAGAVVAAAAVWISDRLEGWGILGRGGESCEGRDSHRS
jgi:membrane-associated phospholipid phosphatase